MHTASYNGYAAVASQYNKPDVADVVNLLVQAGANLNLQDNVSSLTCTYIYYGNTFIYILINNIYTMHTQLLQ